MKRHKRSIFCLPGNKKRLKKGVMPFLATKKKYRPALKIARNSISVKFEMVIAVRQPSLAHSASAQDTV